ncbi:hypothetical protein FA13DRAFT_1744114, partial [Coprinellus micaceus]
MFRVVDDGERPEKPVEQKQMPTGCWIQEMVGAEQAKARTSRVDITEKQQSRLDNCRGPASSTRQPRARTWYTKEGIL